MLLDCLAVLQGGPQLWWPPNPSTPVGLAPTQTGWQGRHVLTLYHKYFYLFIYFAVDTIHSFSIHTMPHSKSVTFQWLPSFVLDWFWGFAGLDLVCPFCNPLAFPGWLQSSVGLRDKTARERPQHFCVIYPCVNCPHCAWITHFNTLMLLVCNSMK